MSSPAAAPARPPVPRPLYDADGRLASPAARPVPAASAEYRPLRGRGRAAALMLGAIMVTDLVAVGSGLLELDLLQRLEAGVPVADAELASNDSRQAAIGIAQVVFYLMAAVLFIAWFHRAYRNVDVVAGPAYRNHGTGWAIGGWFVPILGLWRPKQIANDIWRASAPEGASPRRREPGWLLRVWWIGLIASWIVSRAAIPDDAEQTPQEFQATTTAYLVSDGLDFVVAALAIVVIRQITRQMDAKAAARGSGRAEASASGDDERGPEQEPEDAGGRASVAQPWSTPQTT